MTDNGEKDAGKHLKDNSTQGKGEIYKRISLVMSKVGAIKKDKRAQASGNYAFRGIDDFYNKLQGLMVEHEIFTAPQILSIEHFFAKMGKNDAIHFAIHYRFHFFAPDGSSVYADAVGEGADFGDKACNKCASAAHKYALQQVFMISTQDPQQQNSPPPAGAKTAPSRPVQQRQKPPAPKPPKADARKPQKPSNPLDPVKKAPPSEISHAQRIALWQEAQAKKWTKNDFSEYISVVFGAKTTQDLKKEQFESLKSVVQTATLEAALNEMKQMKKTKEGNNGPE